MRKCCTFWFNQNCTKHKIRNISLSHALSSVTLSLSLYSLFTVTFTVISHRVNLLCHSIFPALIITNRQTRRRRRPNPSFTQQFQVNNTQSTTPSHPTPLNFTIDWNQTPATRKRLETTGTKYNTHLSGKCTVRILVRRDERFGRNDGGRSEPLIRWQTRP